jgi:hypothetical protein
MESNVRNIGKRVTIYQDLGGPRIEIRAWRIAFQMIFMFIWTAGSAYATAAAIYVLVHGDPWKIKGAALIGFALFCMAFLAFGLLNFFWMAYGKDIVHMENGLLVVTRKILFVHRTRRFLLSQVSNLCCAVPSVVPLGPRTKSPFFFGGGSVSFDYGDQTVYFGQNLPDTDAVAIVVALGPFIGMRR